MFKKKVLTRIEINVYGENSFRIRILGSIKNRWKGKSFIQINIYI